MAELPPDHFRYFVAQTGQVYTTTRDDVVSSEMMARKFKEISIEQYNYMATLEDTVARNWQALLGSHPKSTIHILAEGPSLQMAKNMDFSQTITIGMKSAPMVVPGLNYWILCDKLEEDRPLNKWMIQWYQNNRFVRCIVHHTAIDCLDYDPPGFMFRYSSIEDTYGLFYSPATTHAAIDCAMKMGANKIYLWGVDYNNRGHHYSGSAAISDDPKDLPDGKWDNFTAHEQGFIQLDAYAKKHNILIKNCNSNSRLTTFEYCDPAKEFLNEYRVPKSEIPLEPNIPITQFIGQIIPDTKLSVHPNYEEPVAQDFTQVIAERDRLAAERAAHDIISYDITTQEWIIGDKRIPRTIKQASLVGSLKKLFTLIKAQ